MNAERDGPNGVATNIVLTMPQEVLIDSMKLTTVIAQTTSMSLVILRYCSNEIS